MTKSLFANNYFVKTSIYLLEKKEENKNEKI